MSKLPAHNSRARDAPTHVPNTVTRQRFIIRTRAQAQHLGREPLRDALTNSPTKMHRRDDPSKNLKRSSNSSAVNRKRALSPSQEDERSENTAKRLKPLGLTASPTRISSAPVVRPTDSSKFDSVSTPRSNALMPPSFNFFETTRHSSSQGLQATPSTIISAPVVDVFNPEPQTSLSLSEGAQNSLRTVAEESIDTTNSSSSHSGKGSARLAGLQLFDTSMQTDGDQTPRANSSKQRKRLSIANEDDTIMLDSPSKKSKTKTDNASSIPKLSMIPIRVPSSHTAPQPTITSFFRPTAPSHTAGIAPPVKAAINKVQTVSTSSQPLLSPTKGSTSTALRPSMREAPTRPSTSLGFSDPNRRSSLHSSTQASLSNLTSALEKLAMPRIRASLGGVAAAAPLASTASSSTAGVRGVVPGRAPVVGGPERMPFRGANSRSTATRPPTTNAGLRRVSASGTYNNRVGLGRPSTSAIPGRRAFSSMGPPPAPSAATALAVQASTTSHASPLTPPIEPPSASPGAAPKLSPPNAAGVSRDQRNRRASIASRSLADDGALIPELGEISVMPSDGGSGEKKKAKKLTVLKDCVIYVDVKTDDGADAGELFVNMLKGLGARIISRLTPSITHIIFKSGSPTTLSKHKLYNDPKPFMVGIGWVVECVEKREKVDETRFIVDEVESVVTGGKRRKSMVPQSNPFSQPTAASSFNAIPTQLPSMEEEPEESYQSPSLTVSTSRSDTLAPLERARQKSFAFAPKVSSPLKATFKPVDPDGEDDDC